MRQGRPKAGDRHLLMDLSAVTSCDAASLYTLLGVRQAVSHAGGILAFVRVSDAVHAQLQRTGPHQLLVPSE
ncbi:STAS domain-containing protein [Streptomyces lydicus]|nr:STAS domain-containing protein [Streptomyces lydicus]